MKKIRTLAEMTADGMKIKPYMTDQEFTDICMLECAACEAEKIADRYDKVGWKKWSQKLRTASTFMTNILSERLVMLNEKALLTAKRRKKVSRLILRIDDGYRVAPSDTNKLKDGPLEISADDYHTVVEMAMVTACRNCNTAPMETCQLRDIFLITCVPVFSDAGEQCPYRYE